MKIVFFGTPDFVVPVLDSLHKSFKDLSGISPIVVVVTQKPKPVGRKKKITYTPVDNWAHKRNIPKYYDPNDLISENINADIGILAAYGSIISQEILNRFPLGILNIHPSLLPNFRGASPVQATITSGFKTGVTIIKLDNKLDHGPIVTSFKEVTNIDDTTGTLRKRLFDKATEALVDLLPAYSKGKIKLREQDHSKVTFTSTVKKDEALIPFNYIKAAIDGSTHTRDWEIGFMKNFKQKPTPVNIDRFIRAMDPWPIAWTTVQVNKEEKRLKILKAHLEGTKLVLDKVQLEGKNAVSWEQFNQAYPIV